MSGFGDFIVAVLARESSKYKDISSKSYSNVRIVYDQRIKKYDVVADVNGMRKILLTVSDVKMAEWYVRKITEI